MYLLDDAPNTNAQASTYFSKRFVILGHRGYVNNHDCVPVITKTKN